MTEFDPYLHYFHQNYYEKPVIVQGVFSADDCERLTEQLVNGCRSESIDLQRKRQKNQETATTDIYQCSFERALGLVLRSKHDDSLFAFCEGLLNPNTSLQEKWNSAKEDLFQTNKNKENKDDDPCWFSYFPSSAKPSDCVVLAGEGATSTLHRDPFEWTGTNLCLEGTKVWRFVAPPLATQLTTTAEVEDVDNGHIGITVIDDALDSYRLDSIAWGGYDNETKETEEDTLTISAGWQSDYSLFSKRDTKGVPSARSLAELEKKVSGDEKLKLLESIATDCDLLRPNYNNGIDGIDKDVELSLWTGIQQAGDLLIIPAHWWHQTYALEPSLAVASQRCGSYRDAERVVRHILETTSGNHDERKYQRQDVAATTKEILKSGSPKEAVKQLFQHLAKLKKT